MRGEMENCCEDTADKKAADVQCASNDKVARSSVCVYNYIRSYEQGASASVVAWWFGMGGPLATDIKSNSNSLLECIVLVGYRTPHGPM